MFATPIIPNNTQFAHTTAHHWMEMACGVRSIQKSVNGMEIFFKLIVFDGLSVAPFDCTSWRKLNHSKGFCASKHVHVEAGRRGEKGTRWYNWNCAYYISTTKKMSEWRAMAEGKLPRIGPKYLCPGNKFHHPRVDFSKKRKSSNARRQDTLTPTVKAFHPHFFRFTTHVWQED